eukprot:Amastigsp_a340502_211.p6 type:complete len:122 gc:universal Amastigsp_a340502_211:821-1186(+)
MKFEAARRCDCSHSAWPSNPLTRATPRQAPRHLHHHNTNRRSAVARSLDDALPGRRRGRRRRRRRRRLGAGPGRSARVIELEPVVHAMVLRAERASEWDFGTLGAPRLGTWPSLGSRRAVL